MVKEEGMQLELVWDRVNPDCEQRAKKLTSDLEKILRIMLDRKPHLVKDISQALNLPENSVQSQLRHLRKEKHGSFNIVRRSITKGTSYYILEDGFYQRKEKNNGK